MKTKVDLEADVELLRAAIMAPVFGATGSSQIMSVPEYLRWLFMNMRSNGMDPRSGVMRGLHIVANRLEDAVEMVNETEKEKA